MYYSGKMGLSMLKKSWSGYTRRPVNALSVCNGKVECDWSTLPTHVTVRFCGGLCFSQGQEHCLASTSPTPLQGLDKPSMVCKQSCLPTATLVIPSTSNISIHQLCDFGCIGNVGVWDQGFMDLGLIGIMVTGFLNHLLGWISYQILQNADICHLRFKRELVYDEIICSLQLQV